MNKFLVTGGAGFIGSNIVDRLLKEGHKVKVVDNFLTGRRENLRGVIKDIELVEGDIRDLELMKKITKGMDYVIHQAAFRSVPKSVDNPTLTNDINITGTLNTLLAAKAAHVNRVVYASSSSCYGETHKFPQRIDSVPNPISPYAVSKLTGEYYCKVFYAVYGLETISLRYFNVFGPRQNPESKYSTVIPAFIFRMLKDKPPMIDGDGLQSRDFTFVDNVVEANVKSAFADIDCAGKAYNVARGESYSILDIVHHLNKLMKKDITPKFGPPRPGDVKKTQADITSLKTELKVQPKVGFIEGLKRTLEWFLENKVKMS